MENIITERIKKYQLEKGTNYLNASREVIQEVTLYALSTTDFFDLAAFCGGTSLRIAYGLSRASEDLDFSSIRPLESFSFEKYFPAISKVFSQLGLEVSLSEKKKIGSVKSAFIKNDTLVNELHIDNLNRNLPSIKIKLEIDTNPPIGAEYEYKSSLFPFPHRYLIYTLPSLFAGKLHAILCRNWEKGRDYYDYLFYLSKETNINMPLLENALKQTGDYNSDAEFNYHTLEEMLINKFNKTDFEIAKTDCVRFINNPNELSFWNKELFIDLTADYFKKY